MTNILLCGGSGTRLWPLSRTLMPKQFLKIFDDASLFQLTLKRNSKFCSSMMLVSNSEQYFLALDQLEELELRTNIRHLLEPIARDSAPAIALACMALDDDEIVLVSPCDHLIKDEKEYQKVVQEAKVLAQEDYLVTFGIKPLYAETNFGYMEVEEDRVQCFHEKPALEVAKEYLASGNHYWNSGMFCFRVGLFLSELKKHAPVMYASVELAYNVSKKEDLIRVLHEDMSLIPKQSIDYALMEKSKRLKVVLANMGWSDLGSFESLEKEVSPAKDVIEIDSCNNFILSSKQVATIEVDNLIVVDTIDALLIVKKGSSHKVKEVVARLVKRNSSLSEYARLTHRPWGTYEVLLDAGTYKIKRIIVNVGKHLSLQKHFHRNEHWIVLSGTATVQVGAVKKILRANESTYIKMGEIHRLGNEGKIPVVMIEVQVGEYTREDDIVRLEDDYG